MLFKIQTSVKLEDFTINIVSSVQTSMLRGDAIRTTPKLSRSLSKGIIEVVGERKGDRCLVKRS